MRFEFLSDEIIEEAKKDFEYSLASKKPFNKKPYKPTHSSNDRIRAAYEWLDAQQKTRKAISAHYPIKHMIESWAGFYVSRDDVEIAASLMCGVWGEYPYFNIRKALVLPSKRRLEHLTIKNEGYEMDYLDCYKKEEI